LVPHESKARIAAGGVVVLLGVEDVEIAISVNVQQKVEIELHALGAAHVERIPLRLEWRVPVAEPDDASTIAARLFGGQNDVRPAVEVDVADRGGLRQAR